jgi:hypothetical protein
MISHFFYFNEIIFSWKFKIKRNFFFYYFLKNKWIIFSLKKIFFGSLVLREIKLLKIGNRVELYKKRQWNINKIVDE